MEWMIAIALGLGLILGYFVGAKWSPKNKARTPAVQEQPEQGAPKQLKQSIVEQMTLAERQINAIRAEQNKLIDTLNEVRKEIGQPEITQHKPAGDLGFQPKDYANTQHGLIKTVES